MDYILLKISKIPKTLTTSVRNVFLQIIEVSNLTFDLYMYNKCNIII